MTAIRYDGANADAVLAFLGGPTMAEIEHITVHGPGRGLTPAIRVTVPTHPVVRLRAGEWLVREDGTYDALTDDAFRKHYAPIEEN